MDILIFLFVLLICLLIFKVLAVFLKAGLLILSIPLQLVGGLLAALVVLLFVPFSVLAAIVSVLFWPFLLLGPFLPILLILAGIFFILRR